jgi:hypothetical protein
MPRPIEKELSRLLRESQMDFLGNDEIHITRIYELVKNQYPNLCDDDYLCSENCSNGNNQAQWQHVVRGVLGIFKKKGIAQSGLRGFWVLNH